MSNDVIKHIVCPYYKNKPVRFTVRKIIVTLINLTLNFYTTGLSDLNSQNWLATIYLS